MMWIFLRDGGRRGSIIGPRSRIGNLIGLSIFCQWGHRCFCHHRLLALRFSSVLSAYIYCVFVAVERTSSKPNQLAMCYSYLHANRRFYRPPVFLIFFFCDVNSIGCCVMAAAQSIRLLTIDSQSFLFNINAQPCLVPSLPSSIFLWKYISYAKFPSAKEKMIYKLWLAYAMQADLVSVSSFKKRKMPWRNKPYDCYRL